LLLDTHTRLWFYLGDAQLSSAANALILDAGNVKLISPASYWEIAIKVSIGKYALAEPYEDLIQHSIFDNGFDILPIEPRHTAALTGMAYLHRDPFDGLLIAQAVVEGMPIDSADVIFDQYPITRLW
jgi:PIN domain nuclease of toxin-antitoxin system